MHWALMRSLCTLPGGIGRFVLCMIGANHCRLRHIGCEKCGHEGRLPRWPFFMSVWSSSGTLLRFAPALLDGVLPLRGTSKVLTWCLLPCGSVANLVTDGGEEVGIVRAEPCVQVGWVIVLVLIPCMMVLKCAGLERAWWELEKSPTKKKNSSTPCEQRFFMFSISPCVEEVEGL